MSMPTGPLSSNWELLRKRLAASNPPKRKATDDKPASTTSTTPATRKLKRRRPEVEAEPYVRPKIQKINSHTLRKARSMEALAAVGGGGQDTARLASWAEENDIPAADIARAYNIPLTDVKTSGLPAKASAAVPTSIDDPELDKDSAKTEVGKFIAMDCEMVGVGEGERESSALARVSVVNFHGHCVMDCFVKPKERVTDWRTWVSGVSPKNMVNAITFEEAQTKVAELMSGRILIGHAIKNDLECLLIGHPRRDIRDTSRHPEFRKYSKGRTPALKKLAKEILGIEIQGGSHSSVEDARACMLLYRRFKDDFERENQIRFPNQTTTKKSGDKKKKKKSKK